MKLRSSVFGLATIGSLALLLMGCASEPASSGSDVPQLWRDYFNMVLADPYKSDLEQEILEDYRITDAEYMEAVQAYKDCMESYGWVVEGSGRDGGYSFSADLASGNTEVGPTHDVVFECQLGTIDNVEPIYLGMRDNPEGVTWEEQVRTCFGEHNVPDGTGMSDDEFTSMLRDPSYRASTPEGLVCFYDPTGTDGMTAEQAEARADEPVLDATTIGPDGSCGPGCTVYTPKPR